MHTWRSINSLSDASSDRVLLMCLLSFQSSLIISQTYYYNMNVINALSLSGNFLCINCLCAVTKLDNITPTEVCACTQ